MTSTKSSPKPNEKASSKASKGKDAGEDSGTGRGFNLDRFFSREPLDFDLLSQLTHMGAISTSGMSRVALFSGVSSLSYCTSKYFRQVHMVAQRLNYDYSHACEVVADTVKQESVSNLLLHFATALSAGEPEEQFLSREAGLQLEIYSKEYSRNVESLQKWADAYVALMVSAVLIVVISLVSMMIYPFSPIAVVGLAGLLVCVTFVGGWLIFTVAPLEVKTHSLKYRSPDQVLASSLARFLLPLATIVGLGVGWMAGLPFALIASGLIIAPIGYVAFRDDWKIDAYDRDISSFIRALGGVMAAAGLTATDALSRLNRRALGSLEPGVRRLYVRLQSSISPDLAWLRLAAETGSEMVTRTVRIFWDGIRVGGDTAKVAAYSSQLSLKISLERQDRKMVANTFGFVVLALHTVLIGILLFVTEVVQVFGAQLADVQSEGFQSGVAAEAGVASAFLFTNPALTFIPVFIGTVALMLTASNAFAPYAASGGNRLKLCLFGAVMMVISGIVLITVPALVQTIFEGIAIEPGPGLAP